MSNAVHIVLISVVLSALVSGVVSYLVATAKSFREAKQKAYVDLLPAILKVAYDPSAEDQEEFNRALVKLWLYASKDVARKIDRAVGIIHDKTRGDMTKALQEAIAAMRVDIQFQRRFQRIDPDEVKHIFSKVGGRDLLNED